MPCTMQIPPTGIPKALARTLCALLFLLFAPGTRAQQAPVDLGEASLEALRNIEVTSVSKKQEKLSRTAAAIFVITPKDIRRSGATSTPELLSSSERKRLAQILESFGWNCVLGVGEMEGFVQSGGTLNPVLEANKVRFEINASAAERARLKISSKLLALARNVWS